MCFGADAQRSAPAAAPADAANRAAPLHTLQLGDRCAFASAPPCARSLPLPDAAVRSLVYTRSTPTKPEDQGALRDRTVGTIIELSRLDSGNRPSATVFGLHNTRTGYYLTNMVCLGPPQPALVRCGGAWLAASVQRPRRAAYGGVELQMDAGAFVTHADGTTEADVVRGVACGWFELTA